MIKYILLALMLISTSQAQAKDVLKSVNARRTSIGLFPFKADPRLTVLAERECVLQVRAGRMGHMSDIRKILARAAGVGTRSKSDVQGRYFQSCYAATRSYRYAGACAVVSPTGRTYYTLMLR